MNLRHLRWLAALGFSLSLGGTLSAQQPIVWRAAGGRPTTSPVASLGRPVALPAARAAFAPGSPTFRAQSSDAGSRSSRVSPPPTADPLLGDTVPSRGEAGYTTPIGSEIPSDDRNKERDRDRDRDWDRNRDVDRARTSDRESERTRRERDEEDRGSPVGTGMAKVQPWEAPPVKHVVSGPPDEVPPPPTSPFPTGGSGSDVAPGVITDNPVSPSVWDRCVNAVTFGDKGTTHGRSAFESDNCFPGLMSPISMPFYFEDPRALTEVRPIFMYQSIPGDNPYTRGGSAMWFGTQLRLAVSDRLSFVMNELGFLSINPEQATPPFSNSTGFTELKLGPKYTFLRNTDSGTVAAAGMTFEIPCGNGSVFQNTGALSIDPYASIGQTFGIGSGWGSINLLGTTGYSFSVNDKRAEFLYLNFHMDYNIANTNTIFPLFELNWMHYTNTPTSRNLGFEGAYMINFGSSTRAGNDWLSLVGGLRGRISEHVFAGFAAEFPVMPETGFADYRLIFDVIFRF
ncbi:MAG: hypothetical protein U0840_09275 [Gemmataceae bacterium]